MSATLSFNLNGEDFERLREALASYAENAPDRFAYDRRATLYRLATGREAPDWAKRPVTFDLGLRLLQERKTA